MRDIDAVTSGELLKAEFLEPMGITQSRLAKEIGVPAQRISQQRSSVGCVRRAAYPARIFRRCFRAP